MNHWPNRVEPWAQPLQAVAFDMDGLLVNTEELYTQVGMALLQRRGKVFTRELKNAMTGLPGPKAFAVMIEREKLTDSIEQLAAESYQIFGSILPTQLRLLPGVLELLELLESQNRPKCVATSSTPSFAERVLGQVGIFERFDFVITASDVTHGKPFPDIFLAAASRMGVPADHMMVLEDSHHGCKAESTAELVRLLYLALTATIMTLLVLTIAPTPCWIREYLSCCFRDRSEMCLQ
ncbi:MAG: HAD-IA family hydrolase [Pirellulales bacterium]